MSEAARVDQKRGAYVLYFNIKIPLTLQVGSLGLSVFPAGRYIYVGSARRGIAARVLRHKRLALQKDGKLHWHIDYLLVHRHTELSGEEAWENGIECRISKRIAAMSGVTVPVPGFGSSDCRAGCRAHLYLLPSEKSGISNEAKAKTCGSGLQPCTFRSCLISPKRRG
jgi:Uri superfamily endonuclease